MHVSSLSRCLSGSRRDVSWSALLQLDWAGQTAGAEQHPAVTAPISCATASFCQQDTNTSFQLGSRDKVQKEQGRDLSQAPAPAQPHDSWRRKASHLSEERGVCPLTLECFSVLFQ